MDELRATRRRYRVVYLDGRSEAVVAEDYELRHLRKPFGPTSLAAVMVGKDFSPAVSPLTAWRQFACLRVPVRPERGPGIQA